ncbi:MAG: extracellular solute-binding protein [Lachnospiraceae bacterium]|nr:extracellular solute-binding protein [Lachnospiraceae bacterium]
MKKLLALLLCMSMAVSALIGCGSSQGSTASETPASAETSAEEGTASGEKTDILVWLFSADNMQAYVDEGFTERVNEAFPDYNVTVEVIAGTAADMETQYNAAKMSGQVPDVMYVALTTFASFGTRGEWLTLDSYMSDWEGMNDVMEATLNICKLPEGYAGVGMAPAPSVFVYRADMFEAAGLDPDTPPTNWEELAEYAEKLTIKDAQGNIVQGGLDIPSIDTYLNVTAPFMRMNGAVVIDETAQEPLLTDPKVIETLEYLYGLYSKGVSLPHDWQKAETVPFLNGTSAMSFMNLDQYVKLIKENPEMEGVVKIAPPVGNEVVTSFCGYRMMTIPAETKNPDAAWDVIEFIMSKEEMQIRVENQGVIPVRESLVSVYESLNPEIGKTVMETVAVGKGAFIVPWISTLYKYYGPAHEAIMQGVKTPAEAMEEAQAGILAEIG